MADNIRFIFDKKQFEKYRRSVRTRDKILKRQIKLGHMEAGEAVRKAVVRGIRRQRAGWVALSPATIKLKKRMKNLAATPETKLIATGTLVEYFESRDAMKATERGFIVGIPVGKDPKAADGKTSLARVAMVHEFGALIKKPGSDKISRVPARPFLSPVQTEVREILTDIKRPGSMFGRVGNAFGIWIRDVNK